MASDYFGCYQDPGWMSKYLQFTIGGLIIWQSIEKVLCFKFKRRYYNNNIQKFTKALKDPKTVCLLQYKSRHWLVAMKRLPGGYWVADPWV
jgi:hypothetical protein